MSQPADDWQPVTEQDDWQPVGGAQPETVPPAFLSRVRAGQQMQKVLQAAKEGFGEASPTGLSDETINDLVNLGIFHDPTKGRPGPIQFLNETAILPTAKAFDTLLRGVNAGIHGAGEAFGQIVDDLGASQGMGERARHEVINLGNWGMIEAGFGHFSRPAVTGGAAIDQPIGGLPKAQDFRAGAEVLTKEPKPDGAGGVTVRPTTPEDIARVETNLKEQWQERGIHPAEAVHDAQSDAFLKHELTAPRTAAEPVKLPDGLTVAEAEELGIPTAVGAEVNRVEQIARMIRDGKSPTEVMKELNIKSAGYGNDRSNVIVELSRNGVTTDKIADIMAGKPRSLGAAATGEVTTEPPLVPLSQQPSPPPGKLVTMAKDALDRLFDIGRDIQMLTAPMATGTVDSMATAKDFANTLRRNRWEWARRDADIEKRFTPEQRKRMWDAADEESVAQQLGESREHQGLVTLEPAERAAVEAEHAHAQNAWLRANDVGLVESEGLPAYTPRMVVNVAEETSGERALPLNGIGQNLRVKTGQMKHRKFMTAEETEAAAKEVMGEGAQIVRDIRTLPLATAKLEDAIAGRTLINNIKEIGKRTGKDTVAEGAIPAGSEHKWFTIDHPAFRTWRPKFERKANGEPELDGNTVKVVKDADGNIIFEQVPIYVRDDFEGPLRAVLTQKSGPFYNAMMGLKGKTMSMIMNSPLIHNAVEWGRAIPAMPGKVATFKVYFEGNRAKQHVPTMHEAIDAGLVPIGARFFKQDITGVMEQPNLTPGRSWTSQVLAFVPGLFDEAAGTAVKAAIDKAGNFWHNTLLWDRVGDLQMGLYTNFRDDLLAKGVDRQTAARAAAHWANRYAGALPQEAMSDGARKIANMLLFSRSFTLGNMGVMKDMLTGLPRDVMAQIERDVGNLNPEAKGYIKKMAVRKAVAVIGLDIGLMYVMNSLLQNVANVLVNDSTLDKEMHGYAERLQNKLTAVKEHPLELIQPFKFLEDLSATSDNEPGRKDRIRIGSAKDGTAIYARNPVGKIGEEFIGYMTGALDMMRRKQGTIARPAWQIMSNDAGFGRKVYDPNADAPDKYIKNIGLIAAHLVKSQFPEGQISAAADLVKGEGDSKVAALQTFGPIAGVTFSKGAPGGPAVGELYQARAQHQYQVDAALPDIRRQIQRGDIQGATARMTSLGIPPGLQNFYIRTTMNPATRLNGRIIRDFYQYATPEQKLRLERARGQ